MPRILAHGFGLIKFQYHITFINVVFGALIFAEHYDGRLLWRLWALYVSFNVLLYSGLYTINDLADRESDARHSLKRHRPIASGRVPIHEAKRWAAAFLLTGLGSGMLLFGVPIVACYIAVIVINLLYSWGGRDIAYLDAVLNGLPHVVRFVMGTVLVGRWPATTHLVALLLLGTGFSALRRRIERDVEGWEARPSQRNWSDRSLDRVVAGSLLAVTGLAISRWRSAPGFYSALLGTASVLMGGAYWSAWVRRALRSVWTR